MTAKIAKIGCAIIALPVGLIALTFAVIVIAGAVWGLFSNDVG